MKERSAAEADRKRKEEEKRKVLVRVWTEEAIRKWNQVCWKVPTAPPVKNLLFIPPLNLNHLTDIYVTKGSC